jgi:hypothetical protein
MQIFRLIRLEPDYFSALTKNICRVPPARVFDYKVGIIYNASEPNAALLAIQVNAYRIQRR